MSCAVQLIVTGILLIFAFEQNIVKKYFVPKQSSMKLDPDVKPIHRVNPHKFTKLSIAPGEQNLSNIFPMAFGKCPARVFKKGSRTWVN